MSEEHPFKPGVEVVVCRNKSNHNDGEFSTDRVLKLHKTGRFTLASNPSAQWYASKGYHDAHFTGYPTARRDAWSIYHSFLRLSDEESRKLMQIAREKQRHRARCERLAKELAQPNRLSVDASQKIYDLIAYEAIRTIT